MFGPIFWKMEHGNPLILGKCKALWGKPRTFSFVAKCVLWKVVSEFDWTLVQEIWWGKTEKIKGDRRATLRYGIFVWTKQPTHQFECRVEGIPITPRRLFSRTKTPRRKVRDPTSTLPKCPRCEKSKIRKVVDTKFPRYDHYAIRKVRDAKTPRYNKSLTRELPDCIEIENSVACVEYKLERGKIQFSCTQDFFSAESCRFEFRYRSLRSQLPPPPPLSLSLSLSFWVFFI